MSQPWAPVADFLAAPVSLTAPVAVFRTAPVSLTAPVAVSLTAFCLVVILLLISPTLPCQTTGPEALIARAATHVLRFTEESIACWRGAVGCCAWRCRSGGA